jgi:Subtilisin inhibitor-like
MRLLLLAPATLLLAGCGAGDGAASDAATSPGAAERTLVVDYDAGDGTPAQRFTLFCGDAAQGDHPEPAAACARVLRMDTPFEPLPDDRICTELFGGPQTARVTGTWQGDEVDVQLSREDGCAIAQWDALVPLVPEVEGRQPA